MSPLLVFVRHGELAGAQGVAVGAVEDHGAVRARVDPDGGALVDDVEPEVLGRLGERVAGGLDAGAAVADAQQALVLVVVLDRPDHLILPLARSQSSKPASSLSTSPLGRQELSTMDW